MQQPRPIFSAEEIQRAELDRLASSAANFRASRLPMVATVLLTLFVLRPNLPRALLLGVMLLALLLVVRYERGREGEEGFGRSFALRNGLVGVGLHFVFLLCTGALASPLLPAVILLSTMLGGVLGRDPRVWWVRAGQVLSILILAATELLGTVAIFTPVWLQQHRSWPAVLASATVMTGLILASGVVGRRMRNVSDLMLSRAVEARRDLLDAHLTQARELTALSGEIAHELKNPLASVKGLAGLLARDLPAGKPSERLGVLRAEVDRMQGILDEFLNFSRPAVPLVFEPADLGALAADVASLHEGLASARGVRLGVEGEGTARVDLRKTRKILINLVQNAIEASPAGGAVLLRVAVEPGRARVLVDDEGAGVDARVGERVFEAGVTTRAHGSGLGLPIARALARQQGGELSLEVRPEGGCRARLELPGGEAA